MNAEDERAALLAAIIAQPDDDTARLVLADWLQEHGEESWAVVIRTQIGQRPHTCDGHGYYSDCLGCRDSGAVVVAMESGADWNGDPVEPKWRKEFPKPDWFICARGPSPDWTGDRNSSYPCACIAWATFARGFVASCVCPALLWLRSGDAIRAAHPVTSVRLVTDPDLELLRVPDGDDGADLYRVSGRFVEVPARSSLRLILGRRFPGVTFELPPFAESRAAGARAAFAREQQFINSLFNTRPVKPYSAKGKHIPAPEAE